MPFDLSELDASRRNVQERLLHERTPGGHWVGYLSSSALSTATAIAALELYRRAEPPGDANRGADFEEMVKRGTGWLAAHQNDDGGWGDSLDSPSNISTTVLCRAALHLCESGRTEVTEARGRCERWLLERLDMLSPESIADAICRVYGVDRTFSAPILTMCAICGLFDDAQDAWRYVPALPFELALVPHCWYHRVGLPVVSYALPALIAIGQARHHHRPTRNPITRVIRNLARRKTLDVLIRMQPESGGYLEATPITSFVTMSLVAVGRADHPTTQNGIRFLADSVREDGSWPIDTNLATWTTTLAVRALHAARSDDTGLSSDDRRAIIHWLLDQQHKTVHPYTNAAPGGWAWTDLSGGVPDADDTPGALLALHELIRAEDESNLIECTTQAATSAVQWLLDLQNKDGGIPTFCRGWGKLPFDRSSPDLTAHTLRAWRAWRPKMPESMHARLDRAIGRATVFLIRSQREDGAWVPLWFGNQNQSAMENPLYGTARVLLACAYRPEDSVSAGRWRAAMEKGRAWLLAAQNEDGGWGGDAGIASSVEETAMAVEALAAVTFSFADSSNVTNDANASDATGLSAVAIARSTARLRHVTANGTSFPPTPIGLYFAKLWYSERLYPIVFTAAALGRVSQLAGVWRGSQCQTILPATDTC